MLLSPIDIQVINSAFKQIAEQSGVVLQRSAFSPNIKERLDFSVGIYGISKTNRKPRLIGQAEHIPVHLGAMEEGIAKIIEKHIALSEWSEDDIIISNDPYCGGTHLPDIALSAPVYYKDELVAIVTNRAHHADVGGEVAGSMPAGNLTLLEEGTVIEPAFLKKQGRLNQGLLEEFLAKVRSKKERRGDLNAQLAALEIAKTKLIENIYHKYALAEINEAITYLGNRAQRIFTREILKKIPQDNLISAIDYMDNDGVDLDTPVKIAVSILRRDEQLILDFSNSARQTKGNINATTAVVKAAVYYLIRCLVPKKYQTANYGLFEPIEIITKQGTVLNPEKPAGVAAGNVETSQRIVDVVLKALASHIPEIPAASCGSMNNVAIGNDNFSYYETIAGGHGASFKSDGITAHSHMTNTGNTPIEILESHYPLQVMEYSLIKSSGGKGQQTGGKGIRRSVKLLEKASVSLLTERRQLAPYGLYGGETGKTGRNYIIKGDTKPTVQPLPSKISLDVDKNNIIVIETPGGGGYGNTSNFTQK